MEIRFIDEKHAADINIPNEPFPIRGRMVITYNGDRWEHTEKLLPSEQIEEMTFPDENYNYPHMWESFEQCMALFREVSSEVACQLDYQYPLYDEKISNYVIRQKKKYGIEDDNK